MSTATQQDLDEQALSLQAQGLSYLEIGQAMGETRETAWRRCNRLRANASARIYKAKRREAMRAYDHAYGRAHRGTCTSCGRQMGVRVRDDGECRKCRMAHAAEKNELVARLWAEGVEVKEIARQLGTTPAAAHRRIGYMRQRGWDLPKRPPGGLK